MCHSRALLGSCAVAFHKGMEVLQLCCHAAADLVQLHSCVTIIYTCFFELWAKQIYTHAALLPYNCVTTVILHLYSFVAMQLCNRYDTYLHSYSFVAMQLCNQSDTCTHTALLACNCLSILCLFYFIHLRIPCVQYRWVSVPEGRGYRVVY